MNTDIFKIVITIIVIGVILLLSGSVFASIRIVSLAPSITEILFALGLEDEIVGVSSYCDYPPQAYNIETVGDFSHPSLECIVSLKPDIVFAAGIEQKDTIDKLKKININVKAIKPLSIIELYKFIEDVGKLTKKSCEAKQLINKMKNSVSIIQKKHREIPITEKPTVFILLWHDPLLTAGDNSFVSDIIKHAGGINIAGDLIYSYSRYNLEVLIEKSPDYILVCSMENGIDDNYLNKLSNLTGSKIIDNINPDIILRPGPRIIKGIESIYKKLYEN